LPSLSKKKLDLFCSEVERWRDKFGLIDWLLNIDTMAEDENEAQCYGHYEGRVATISIQEEWDEIPDDRKIKILAFHEVCELLFMKLSTLAEHRFVSEKELQSARHEIIQTLTNVFGKDS
jgi:hypothetical protein